MIETNGEDFGGQRFRRGEFRVVGEAERRGVGDLEPDFGPAGMMVELPCDIRRGQRVAQQYAESAEQRPQPAERSEASLPATDEQSRDRRQQQDKHPGRQQFILLKNAADNAERQQPVATKNHDLS
ncbi:hypothetical protein SDC9_82988 [bioreactor metagenome]|uniref:Uncharacterized protein n=1 Tax=bioreactor metagenome TaxID=1076179 RepID=A0A644Z6F0_9ZZZZ